MPTLLQNNSRMKPTKKTIHEIYYELSFDEKGLKRNYLILYKTRCNYFLFQGVHAIYAAAVLGRDCTRYTDRHGYINMQLSFESAELKPVLTKLIEKGYKLQFVDMNQIELEL